MIVVLDASVVLKWLIQDRAREPDTPRATELVEAAIDGRLQLIQPVHWLAEVAGALARLFPAQAVEDVAALQAMEIPTVDEPAVWVRAVRLAVGTGQHLFDTLYHAVALENDAVLVTADDRYRLKALSYGRIAALRDWVAPST